MSKEGRVFTECVGAAPAFYVAGFLHCVVHSVLVLSNVSTASGSTTMVHFKTYLSELEWFLEAYVAFSTAIRGLRSGA